MPLQGKDRRLTLRLGGCAREKCLVCGVEPSSGITIEQPMAPAFRIAEFGFERPAIATPVDQFRAAVLASGRNDPEAQTQESLLRPLGHFFRLHSRATHKVHREAEAGIREARTVYRSGLPREVSLKIPHRIGQRGCEVRGSSEETE